MVRKHEYSSVQLRIIITQILKSRPVHIPHNQYFRLGIDDNADYDRHAVRG